MMMVNKVIKPRQKRPSVNLDTSSCLHVHVYENNVTEISKILNNNFSEYLLNVRDDTGRTPLYLAACYRRIELAKLLMDAGCDTKIPQENGNTVLHEAVEKNCQEIVAEVLKHDSSLVDVRNNADETAVFKAAYFDYDGILKTLIKFSASPDIANNAGVSPLLCALSEGSEKSAIYLIQSGCDVNKMDHNDNTTLKIILHSKHIKGFEQIIEDLLGTDYDFPKDSKWLLGCKRHSFYKKDRFYQKIAEAAGLPLALPDSNLYTVANKSCCCTNKYNVLDSSRA